MARAWPPRFAMFFASAMSVAGGPAPSEAVRQTPGELSLGAVTRLGNIERSIVCSAQSLSRTDDEPMGALPTIGCANPERAGADLLIMRGAKKAVRVVDYLASIRARTRREVVGLALLVKWQTSRRRPRA
jgi:hypothetical protein